VGEKKIFQTFRSVHIFCLHFGKTNVLLNKCIYTVDLLSQYIYIFYNRRKVISQPKIRLCYVGGKVRYSSIETKPLSHCDILEQS